MSSWYIHHRVSFDKPRQRGPVTQHELVVQWRYTRSIRIEAMSSAKDHTALLNEAQEHCKMTTLNLALCVMCCPGSDWLTLGLFLPPCFSRAVCAKVSIASLSLGRKNSATACSVHVAYADRTLCDTWRRLCLFSSVSKTLSFFSFRKCSAVQRIWTSLRNIPITPTTSTKTDISTF